MILWDVDTQVDFIEPQGKLYAPGAEVIRPNLARLTRWAVANGILILGDVDAHHIDDKEFEQYPPHCLTGTPGQKKIPETQVEPTLFIPNRPVDLPESLGDYRQVILEKQHVDVFTNPNVEALLRRLEPGTEITVYGVVTEVCVALASCGLLDRGFPLRIVRDAIHPFKSEEGEATLVELQQRGAHLVTTEEVLAGESHPAALADIVASQRS